MELFQSPPSFFYIGSSLSLIIQKDSCLVENVFFINIVTLKQKYINCKKESTLQFVRITKIQKKITKEILQEIYLCEVQYP